MADGGTRWRTRRRLGAVLFSILIQVVNGYEEIYPVSQLSPKSISHNQLPEGVVLQTSQDLEFNLEPSANYDAQPTPDNSRKNDEEEEEIIFIKKSREPTKDREARSLHKLLDIPISNSNEIDNDIELHNKRKYYDIHPTRTTDFLRRKDDEILMSEGFGDRLEFRFPGEGNRVPKARALSSPGPQINPTAVQPIFATASLRDQGRQNTEIQNIITGIVKLLNGNVNVQANSQLLNGRPGRPMASRINNRGPPRISDLPPILPDFDGKPITPPSHVFHPTKTPPPYPFDRPPHHGVNLPEQIVPPLVPRPGFHRPLPPWQRPKPRPQRPRPGVPMYKPMPPLPHGLPDLDDSKPEEELHVNENETSHSENNIHHDEKDIVSIINLPEIITNSTTNVTTNESNEEQINDEKSTTDSSSTSTTETITSTTEKLTTTEEPTTEKPSTTTEIKTEKPAKPADKKKEVEKEKINKLKPAEEKTTIKIPEKKDEVTESVVESSISEVQSPVTASIALPTPTDGLISYAPTFNVTSSAEIIKTSSIVPQPSPTPPALPNYPPFSRKGIVLDDPDFKPKGSRPPVEVPVITAQHNQRPGYGGDYLGVFDVTVSAVQGPGGEKGSAHIEHVNLAGLENDDVIMTASGDQGFVSIDGKKLYLNLFDTSTAVSVQPSRVQSLQNSVPPLQSPPLSGPIGTGVAIPADDIPQPPKRPFPATQQAPHLHPPPGYHGLHRPQKRPPASATVRIDTCIVGDDSTCDQAQNEKCRTEAGISSCQCRPGYARRIHRDPCRRVVALVLNMRVDKFNERKVVWDNKLLDKESDPYQQLSYEAVRAIDSAFAMTPFSDDFVSGSVNSVHRGDQTQGVFVNYTVLLQETPEMVRSAIAKDIYKHVLGVIRRRSNNIGQSSLWVDTPAGAVLPIEDLDECATSDFNDCHPLATCSNTWGGFRCTCPDTTLDASTNPLLAGRDCRACASSHCNERGVCRYRDSQPYCSCTSGYYGSTCEVDGEVVGVAVGASLAAALVIALTLAALLSWSRKWSREAKAAGMGSPVFSYMAANSVKTPPVGGPPYQVSLEERLRWAQIAEAMAQANHYAQPEATQTMATRPSSAMFGGYPTLPPVPMPRMTLQGHHTGTMNTIASRMNTSHHNLYGYTNHLAAESTSSEASSHAQERADLLVPRPKSRARSMHNQTGIYYDVEYENAPEAIYGSKGIPLSTYTVCRGPPFYRT